MSREEVLGKLMHIVEYYVEPLRRASPCYCVPKEIWRACITCGVDLSNAEARGKVRRVLLQVIRDIEIDMHKWDEYVRDARPQYNVCDYWDYHRDKINLMFFCLFCFISVFKHRFIKSNTGAVCRQNCSRI